MLCQKGEITKWTPCELMSSNGKCCLKNDGIEVCPLPHILRTVSLNEQTVSTLCRTVKVFNNLHPGNDRSAHSGSSSYGPSYINVLHSLSIHCISFSHKSDFSYTIFPFLIAMCKRTKWAFLPVTL